MYGEAIKTEYILSSLTESAPYAIVEEVKRSDDIPLSSNEAYLQALNKDNIKTLPNMAYEPLQS